MSPVPPEEIDPAPAPPPGKTYEVGTLSYSMRGLKILFFWLLWGDFAWSMRERSVGAVVTLMLKKFGATDLVGGLMISTLPNIVGVVLGPIISYRSDRHRGPRGRRIPFLLVTTPIAAAAMAALAFCPQLAAMLDHALGAHSPGPRVSAFIVFGILWTTFECASIAGNSVFGALNNDVVPHTLIGRFYGAFRALSLTAGIIFNTLIFGNAEKYFAPIFIGLAALYGVGVMMMCFKVKEGEYPPPPPPNPRHGVGFLGASRTYFKECFSNSYYVWIFIAYTLSWVCFSPVNTYSIFFEKSLNMSNQSFGNYVGATYFISLSLSWFLGVLADRFHPLQTGMVTLVLYAAVTLWGGIFIHSQTTFAIALILHGVLSGVYFTVAATLGQRLFPRARYAQFNSALEAVRALFTILLIPVVGRFLDLSNHVYRYTYLISCVMALSGLAASFIVYRRFIELGGRENYVAPE